MAEPSAIVKNMVSTLDLNKKHKKVECNRICNSYRQRNQLSQEWKENVH